MSIYAYYSISKGLWDKLSSYNDLSICSGGVAKKTRKIAKKQGDAISHGAK